MSIRGSDQTSRRGHRATRFAGAFTLVLAGLGGALLAGCGGDDDSDDGARTTVAPATGPTADALATGDALAAMRELTTRIAPAVGESIETDACPMGDMLDIVAQGPAEVRAVTEVDPVLYQYVFQSELAGEHPFITCMAETADGIGNVGISVGEVVPDFKADTVRVLSAFTLDFEREYAHLGGTVLQYCATSLEEAAPFCEVDWFDGNVWVGVFITTDARSVAVADEWLRAVLPGVLETVVTTAPTVQPL